MTIKKFIIFSVVAHIAFFLALSIMPQAEKEKERKPIVTSLVSPEDLMKKEEKPPSAKKGLPSAPKPALPVPRRVPPVAPGKRSEARQIPRIPAPPPSRPAPSEEKPVVPGEGREDGKPLPEGVVPKPGKGTPGMESGAGEGKGKKGSETSRRPGLLDSRQLFDRDVIGQVAREDKGKRAGRPRKDDAITFDTNEYAYMGYMRRLREKIESIWVYPPDAAAKNIWGDLKIRFTIKKDGTLGAVELVRTSGYKSLDDAAMKALKDGEPYWPLPDSWGMDSYTILGHFIYSMYGYQQIR